MPPPHAPRPNDTPKGTPLVTVIILNLNSFDVTHDCLQSLRKIDYPNYEIIVVDNGSVDGSGTRLAEADPHVRLIRNERNLGFAAGCNPAIRDALARGADYVLLLNNDTVVAPDFLSQMIAVAETDPSIAVLNPKIYYFDEPDRFNYAGGEHKVWRLFPKQIAFREKDVGQCDEIREVSFLSGCAMLIRTSALRSIGLFDEIFFHFFEDISWSLRAIRAGYKGVYVPKAVIWHKEHYVTHRTQRNGFIDFYLARNQVIFARRYVPMRYWPLKFSWFGAWLIYRSLGFVTHGEWIKIASLFRGDWEGCITPMRKEDIRR